jgi:cytoskeleton protein RodZ
MQSIGERLEEARKRKGISIREAAEATKIRGEYLHKFESNQYDIKLPEIYVRGFLRTYANYLKLPGEKIINDYNGLGLNEAKQRTLNREVYGRMDLSVSNAKAEKGGKEPGSDTPAEGAASPESATRNPATFVPQGGNGAISIDKKLLIKFGAIAAAAILVIVVGLWALFGRGSSTPPAPLENWVRAQSGEPTLTLVPKGTAVKVAVYQISTGETLYDGIIPQGDTREIPRRGKIRIQTDTPEKLNIRIAGAEYDLKQTSGAYLRSTEIKAP